MIGNVIGEENTRLGKLLCLMTVIYSTLISSALGCLTYTFSHEIAYAYTEDETALESLDPCLKSLAFSLALCGLALSLQGTLKALQL